MKKVDFFICDTYNVFSEKKVFENRKQEWLNRRYTNAVVRHGLKFVKNNKGNGGTGIVGANANSTESLGHHSFNLDTNDAAKEKKFLAWRKDTVQQANKHDGKGYFLPTELFVWGSTNNGWVFNRHPKETFWTGEINTSMQHEYVKGIKQAVGEDNQAKDCVRELIFRFTNEGDLVWDMLGNIPFLEEICKEMKRGYVTTTEINVEENEDQTLTISFGDFEKEFAASDLDYGCEVPVFIEDREVEVVVTETTTERNIINHEDVFEWLDKIADKSIDLLLTDPPYNVSVKGATTAFGNGRVGLDFGDWDFGFRTDLWTEKVATKLKDESQSIIFNSFRNMETMADVFSSYGFEIVGLPYWIKSNPTPHLFDRVPVNAFEYTLWVRKGNPTFNALGDSELQDAMLTQNGYVQEGRWLASQHEDQKNRFHTTQKPASMFGKIIDTLTTKESVILECFSGSGVTATVCIAYDREFYATELDDTYWKLSTERIETQKKTSKKTNIWV